MFINPKTAIENGWIKGIADPEKQIQPNAIDFTLDKLYQIASDTTFVVSEQGKQMRSNYELKAAEDRRNPELSFWQLQPQSVYDGMSNMYVTVPDGVAVQLIIRSTFNRNGLFLTSGLYDSGFEGNIGFALHNRSGEAKVAVGTRVGQIIFVESDSHGKYAGGYNTEDGEHWNK